MLTVFLTVVYPEGDRVDESFAIVLRDYFALQDGTPTVDRMGLVEFLINQFEFRSTLTMPILVALLEGAHRDLFARLRAATSTAEYRDLIANASAKLSQDTGLQLDASMDAIATLIASAKGPPYASIFDARRDLEETRRTSRDASPHIEASGMSTVSNHISSVLGDIVTRLTRIEERSSLGVVPATRIGQPEAVDLGRWLLHAQALREGRASEASQRGKVVVEVVVGTGEFPGSLDDGWIDDVREYVGSMGKSPGGKADVLSRVRAVVQAVAVAAPASWLPGLRIIWEARAILGDAQVLDVVKASAMPGRATGYREMALKVLAERKPVVEGAWQSPTSVRVALQAVARADAIVRDLGDIVTGVDPALAGAIDLGWAAADGEVARELASAHGGLRETASKQAAFAEGYAQAPDEVSQLQVLREAVRARVRFHDHPERAPEVLLGELEPKDGVRIVFGVDRERAVCRAKVAMELGPHWAGPPGVSEGADEAFGRVARVLEGWSQEAGRSDLEREVVREGHAEVTGAREDLVRAMKALPNPRVMASRTGVIDGWKGLREVTGGIAGNHWVLADHPELRRAREVLWTSGTSGLERWVRDHLAKGGEDTVSPDVLGTLRDLVSLRPNAVDAAKRLDALGVSVGAVTRPLRDARAEIAKREQAFMGAPTLAQAVREAMRDPQVVTGLRVTWDADPLLVPLSTLLTRQIAACLASSMALAGGKASKSADKPIVDLVTLVVKAEMDGMPTGDAPSRQRAVDAYVREYMTNRHVEDPEHLWVLKYARLKLKLGQGT